MTKGKEIKKVIKETIKYLILTPPNHNIISPLEAINIEVPRSGWAKTKIIGKIIITRAINILEKVLTFSIFFCYQFFLRFNNLVKKDFTRK